MLWLFESLWTYRVVRVVLALMFITAGALKLTDLDAFARIIAAFGVLPLSLVPWAALLLPPLEILAAVALLFDQRWGLNVITGLILLFLGVLTYGISLGLDVDCGCYGPGDPEGQALHSLWTSLYRDLGMLCMTLYLYWRRWRRTLRGRSELSSNATQSATQEEYSTCGQ